MTFSVDGWTCAPSTDIMHRRRREKLRLVLALVMQHLREFSTFWDARHQVVVHSKPRNLAPESRQSLCYAICFLVACDTGGLCTRSSEAVPHTSMNDA